MIDLSKNETELVRILRKSKQKNVKFDSVIKVLLKSSLSMRKKLNLLRHIFKVAV